MKNKKQEEIDTLNAEIHLLLDSGLSIKEFIRKRLFEKYMETGDSRIKDIAAEYFVEKLGDDDSHVDDGK